MFERSLLYQFEERLRIEHKLRRAIEENEIDVWYQPIISISTGRVHGVEALARWPDGEGSMISPDIFIPLAEECNLIGALSKLVVEKCCQDAKRWLSTREIQTISVNISARQMLHEAMVQEILGVLGRNNVPFNQVIFEITESTLMEDSESGRKIMERLHALGIQLALDDFGSGYSNLKQLSAAPISVLKIDRSLLQGVESNQKASSIYENAIALGKKLHMLTVSEGVETQAELDFVTQCGCDLVQGYFFGKPCQAGEMQDLLKRCNRSAART